ncbi:VOC family protein [Rossellomorea marisflavi]|uniref:VOC family protein n=1 Tax=Rossellomorea marisflavi TaxID=189381 RepID=UPI00064E63A7|nr:VOC family protein [Rossellomorea marisflavi]KML34990.1 glyoxalase [Rossellomorea marisflavi]
MGFHESPNTYVGNVTIKVTDLERSLSFYKEVIGFDVLEHGGHRAVLTADGKVPLLTIIQPEGVQAKQGRTTGLYHFAILLPSRKELGKSLHHLLASNIQLGSGDHEVSEALYLSDPDGNGIEIYRDRPSSDWVWNGDQVRMGTEPVDARAVLAESNDEPWTGLPAETVMGHIHLHVDDLKAAEAFYHDGLGFDVVTRYGGQAIFMSTGRYHHHIGLNTWNGTGAPRPAENQVGLDAYTLIYPSQSALDEAAANLRAIGAKADVSEDGFLTEDPAGNKIKLITI